MEDRCICCGEIIPEGRQICINCENNDELRTDEMDEKKVREVIEWMKNERKIHKCSTYISPLIPKEQISFVEEYYDLAIEALEKQLPKKVEVKEWSPAICPSCGTELSDSLGDGYYTHPTYLKRCPNPDCGQRLDW